MQQADVDQGSEVQYYHYHYLPRYCSYLLLLLLLLLEVLGTRNLKSGSTFVLRFLALVSSNVCSCFNFLCRSFRESNIPDGRSCRCLDPTPSFNLSFFSVCIPKFFLSPVPPLHFGLPGASLSCFLPVSFLLSSLSLSLSLTSVHPCVPSYLLTLYLYAPSHQRHPLPPGAVPWSVSFDPYSRTKLRLLLQVNLCLLIEILFPLSIWMSRDGWLCPCQASLRRRGEDRPAGYEIIL